MLSDPTIVSITEAWAIFFLLLLLLCCIFFLPFFKTRMSFQMSRH
jgi:uncharacterized membrane protein